MRPARWLWLVTLLLVLASGTAAAEPQPITLDAYKARLQDIAGLLERNQPRPAAVLADGTWQVATPRGPVQADLRPLHQVILDVETGHQSRDAALRLVREHLAAADATVTATAIDTAATRKKLDAALKRAEDEGRAWDAFTRWLARIFGRSADRAASAVNRETAPYLSWGAIAIGLAGVSLLAFSLMRNLSGQGGGEDGELKATRSRPDRPATPAELRQAAARAAAEGDYKEALRLGHLSLLQRLDEVGLIRYVPAQTNREHERQLGRKHPALARPLHDLNDLIDVRLFAGYGATAEDYERADRLIEQLWREGDAVSKSAGATTGAS